MFKYKQINIMLNYHRYITNPDNSLTNILADKSWSESLENKFEHRNYYDIMFKVFATCKPQYLFGYYHLHVKKHTVNGH